MDKLQCSLARLPNDPCQEDFLSKSTDLFKLEGEDLEILKCRILPAEAMNTDVICAHHKTKYLDQYPSRQLRCSDPFLDHKYEVRKKSLRGISYPLYKKFSLASIVKIIPGKKLCSSCYRKVLSLCDAQNHTDEPLIVDISNLNTAESTAQQGPSSSSQRPHVPINSDSGPIKPELSKESQVSQEVSEISSGSNPQVLSNPESLYYTSSQEEEQKTRKLKRMLDGFQLPLPKRTNVIKNLEKSAVDVVEKVNVKLVQEMNDTYDIHLDPPSCSDDSRYLMEILNNVKSKFNSVKTFDEKVSVLTLLPADWKYNQVREHFKCSRHMYRKFVELRKTRGVLPDPPKRKTNYIHSEELINSIINFYRSDMNSRICSGMSEKKSVRDPKTNIKSQLQKRYLLYDLKDLHRMWLETEGGKFNTTPGLAFFADLRPKECVLAGSPGTHNVCVCSQHQNVKLKLQAVSKSVSYKDIMELAVCSTDSQSCMLHTCPHCPGPDAIQRFLQDQDFYESKTRISYMKWKSVDVSKNPDYDGPITRVTLEKETEDAEVFYEGLKSDLWNLSEHQYITETQKKFFHDQKQDLPYHIALLVMDFAENYAFIGQDTTQAFYFNNIQATLHPVVIYYKREGSDEVEVLSFCVISDHMKHNSSTVQIFQEKVIAEVKKSLPWISEVIYWTDGAPSQYKNKNYFGNLCSHEENFGMKVHSHNYFATSHGKNACDGIGAVVKRFVRKASLRLPPEQQILTPRKMFEYLDENMKTIKFIWVGTEECVARQESLQSQISSSKTVKDTRKYHFIKPINQNCAEFKVVSSEQSSKKVQVIKG